MTSTGRCNGGTAGRSDHSSWLTRSDSMGRPSEPRHSVPAHPELEILRTRARSPARHRLERGRESHRSRGRCACGIAALENERHRRRRTRDAPARCSRSLTEFFGARRHRRGPQLLGRRESDVASARSAGRQLGRDRRDRSRISKSDHGPALFGCSGRHRPVRSDAGGRLRDRPAR